MTPGIKSARSLFAQPKTEPNANEILFLDERLTAVPPSGIPEDFRTLSRFFPIIVLVPKSTVEGKKIRKSLTPNRPDSGLSDGKVLPLDLAKAWVKNAHATDMFEFGGVTGCFSTMEIYRNEQPVTLTNKEFKTLAYLIKNPRRVISRDELLNEVWGYDNYPCTRTVDNHILRLRRKLESNPSNPKHFHTVHCAGYRFSP
jgi:DNA-binding winged helix-turn-helix (wHTH) protein